MSEPSGPDPADYKLSGAELQQAFETRIQPELDGPSHAAPIVVCVTGPMATGKTTTMSAVPALFNIPDAARIDSDWYVAAHRDYLPLRAQYGDVVARKMTGHVMSPLWGKAVDFVHEHQRNAVISGPMSDPQWFAEKFTPLRDDGIRVPVVSVAVHPARSLLSAVDRFHQREAASIGDGVWFDPAWHDRHVDGTRKAIEAIERDGLADELHIAERGGQFVYSNRLLSRDPIQWENEPGGVEALDAVRSRAWTDEEHAHHHDRAIALMNSPLLDDGKRLVVVDAINRSFEPNDRAIAALHAEAHALEQAIARGAGPAVAALPEAASPNERSAAGATDYAAVDELRQRADQRVGYSNELRAVAEEWASVAPPWAERPYGNVPDPQLSEQFANAEQRRETAADEAGTLREQVTASGTTAQDAEAAATRLDEQRDEFASAARAIHAEQVVRAALPPERAATENAQRSQHVEAQQTASLDPEAAEAIALLAEQQRPSADQGTSPTTDPVPSFEAPGQRPPTRSLGESSSSEPGR